MDCVNLHFFTTALAGGGSFEFELKTLRFFFTRRDELEAPPEPPEFVELAPVLVQGMI